MPHEEGCFSPAVGQVGAVGVPAWNNPANRGPVTPTAPTWPAGPRALRVPGRVVDTPPRASRAARPRCRAAPSTSTPRPGQGVGPVSTRLHLQDLRLAWEARDPELVKLIEALAEQPDEPPETPV